jgi:uncharacterized integral membrane protein
LSGLWLRFKVWTKVALFALLSLYVLTFIYKNMGPPVTLWVWYFAEPIPMPVLLLAFVSFVIGVIGTILSRTTFKTIRQLRELREKTRAHRLEREVADMRTKAAMLRSRAAPGAGEPQPPAETELL